MEKLKIMIIPFLVFTVLWHNNETFDVEGGAMPQEEPGIMYCAGFDGNLLCNLPIIRVTDEEYEMLAHLVMAEAEGEPLDGKIAVINVVINRCRNRKQNVKTVIFSPHQFCTSERFKLNPTQECYLAVDLALDGYKVIPNEVEYFCERTLDFPLDYVMTIGNHKFYKEEGIK